MLRNIPSAPSALRKTAPTATPIQAEKTLIKKL